MRGASLAGAEARREPWETVFNDGKLGRGWVGEKS